MRTQRSSAELSGAISKPLIYIASPYTEGETGRNVLFQLQTFDQLLTDQVVVPFAPLWSHFQHVYRPQPYGVWLSYGKSMLTVCDACLRLTTCPNCGTVKKSGHRRKLQCSTCGTTADTDDIAVANMLARGEAAMKSGALLENKKAKELADKKARDKLWKMRETTPAQWRGY